MCRMQDAILKPYIIQEHLNPLPRGFEDLFTQAKLFRSSNDLVRLWMPLGCNDGDTHSALAMS